jgi:sulfur-oxidizing protein SoxZ
MAPALINVPATAKRGDAVEIKVLISHPMETGYRHSASGALISRNIIHTLLCTYDGEEVFRAELFPAIAANPFIWFFTVATNSAVVALSWTGDDGKTQTQSASITVE